jgi:hypothetical protein
MAKLQEVVEEEILSTKLKRKNIHHICHHLRVTVLRTCVYWLHFSGAALCHKTECLLHLLMAHITSESKVGITANRVSTIY